MCEVRLLRRYNAVLKDGSKVRLELAPENCYYFYEQESKYLCLAISKQLKDEEVDYIEPIFVCEKTEPYQITIGL